MRRVSICQRDPLATTQHWQRQQRGTGMSDAPTPRSDALMKAIQHALDEAELAYAFRAGSYTASALNAVLAVEAVYLLEAERMERYLDQQVLPWEHGT
jgi:hypothetical protein